MRQYLEKHWAMGEITTWFEGDFKTFIYSSLHPVITQKVAGSVYH